MISEKLIEIYELLLERFGPQHWWPGETRLEIIVGAILTQNTNWGNVERAIANLKAADCLTADKLYRLDITCLAELIRPAGYYNIKARRLRNFLIWLFDNHNGRLEDIESLRTEQLRACLLTINGIGRETADSILLYAFDRAVFVIDAYTARVVFRHGLIEPQADYEGLRELFQSNLPQNCRIFNEYHALMVKVGKEFCRPAPKCSGCPLEGLSHNTAREYF
jgi:endonuclease-3 related protein